MVTYKNRYGDQFTFTKDEEGNILWEGNFTYCRIGYPNDYTKAYNAYVHDHKHVKDAMTFNQFEKTVYEYDDETNQYIYDKYVRMVESIKNKISMVDPSGGPYITSGNNMGRYGEEFDGMIVNEFKKIPTGYKIIIK